MKKIKFDQLSALIILSLSLVYVVLGSFTEVDFYNGLLGPHHWIYILGGILGFLAFLLLIQPTDFFPKSTSWKDWNYRIPFIIGIFLYVAILPYTGFLTAMIALMFLIGILFGATKIQALINAFIMSIICFFVFDGLLGISLGRSNWLPW